MMSPLRLLRRLRALLTRSRRDQELDAELEFHLAMDTEARARHGESDARAAAEHRLGGVLQVKDAARDARGVRPVEDLLFDLRTSLRSLWRKPSFTAATLATFALGVGGVAAVFGAVHGIILTPLPYHDPDRLVVVQEYDRKRQAAQEVSPANFLDWRRQVTTMDLAGVEPYGLDWLSDNGPIYISTWLVSERFFDIAGTRPLLGRAFREDEHTPGQGNVVVLGWELWQREFGGDSSIVGSRLTLDGAPWEVVGVMHQSFDLPHGGDVAWAPKTPAGWEATARTSPFYEVLGRLKDGVALPQAEADLERVTTQLGREYPSTNADIGSRVTGLTDHIVGRARKALWLLFGAVGLVMLVAAANLTSLQLARAIDRGREFAVRSALGAGRGRITRQIVAETLVLAGLGSALGFGLARLGLAAIQGLAPPELPRPDQLRADGMVLLVSLLVGVITAIASGMVPAIVTARSDPSRGLALGGRGFTANRGARSLRSLLVTGQFAVTLVLVVGAGLLVRSFVSVLREDRGFRSERVLVMVAQSWSYFQTPEARGEFVRQAMDRIGAIPGVESVGMASAIPLLEPIAGEQARVSVPGRPVDPNATPEVHFSVATGGFFDALSIQVLAGRVFGPDDRAGSAPVTVVNRSFVQRFLGNDNPIGRKVMIPVFRSAPIEREIVGVVADVRRTALHEQGRPAVYLPHAQAPLGAVGLVIRTAGDPDASVEQVKRSLWSLSAAMPVSNVTTMERLVGESVRERRFLLALLTSFAAVGIGLAATGIFGVMSYVTGERTREIGVRMAFGADRGRVLRMILGDGGRLAGAGIVIGVLGAIALTRLLTGMLYQVKALDPLSFGAGAGLLLLVALGATLVPARRAARLDPNDALRSE